MFTTKKLENIKKLNCYLSQRADILQGIYLLNENILKKRLLNGERIILGVRVDNIFVRRKKICTRHPEGFATEEIARFDVAWPEEVKEELKESTLEKEEVEITSN